MALQILRQVSKILTIVLVTPLWLMSVHKEYSSIYIRWVGQGLQDHENFTGLFRQTALVCLTEAIKDEKRMAKAVAMAKKEAAQLKRKPECGGHSQSRANMSSWTVFFLW